MNTNEKEADLLKATFKDNEYLLKVLRSLFFGFDVKEEDKEIIKKFSPELKEAIRKKIYPLLSNEVPIGQVADFWMGTEQNVFGQSKDSVFQAIASKTETLNMLNRAMELMNNPDGDKIDLSFKHNLVDELGINLLSRNLYIRTIETGLNFIKLLAEQKSEVEVKEKQKLNSNK